MVALVVLAAVPALLVGVPALAGHLWLPGDDLTQNYPLRALVGTDLRHGHLPLWNPYIWAGTPLLGGFNAGAFYPATLLFAFLPGPAAWAVGQVATLALAGWGMHLFLRAQRLGPLASWLGAFTFSFSGFMVAHVSHIGLAEGMGWLGWILLALHRLADDPPAPYRWAAALGALGGLVCLTGEPRAISDVSVVAGGYALWLVCTRPRRARLAGWLAGAAVVAGLIGAAQLAPGLASVAGSQRAHLSFDDWAAGSLSPAQFLLLAVPFANGGFASLRLPPYAGAYNIVELTGYAGLLTLAGGLASLAGGARRRGRPRDGTLVWALVAAVGVVLALGSHTPAGRLLWRIPLYGGERLQNRNLGVVAAAMSVLFAAWADRTLSGERGPLAGRVLGLLAPVGVGGLTVAAVVAPGSASAAVSSEFGVLPRAWPYLIASLVTAGAVVGLVCAGHRLAPGRRRVAVVAVTAADLGFFLANAAIGWAPTAVLHPGPGSPPAVLASRLAGHRYALYDQALSYPAYRQAGTDLVPIPDLNVLSRAASVQGYGSLVAGDYQRATGTHDAGLIDPAILSGPLADRLDLKLLLIEPDDQSLSLGGLDYSRWRPAGELGGLTVLANRSPLGPAWLERPGAQPSPGSVAVRTEPWGAARVEVTTPAAATLVRSEAWAPGWEAEVVGGAAGSAARWRPVARDGLLQSVPVPAGRSEVRFRYRPRRVPEGLAASAAGVVIAGSAPVVARARRRRARRTT